MNPVIIVAIIALVVGVAAFNIIRSLTIRKKGIETDGVISRIDEHGGVDITYTYYVKYRTIDGKDAEAMLNHAPANIRVGETVRIKYLPEKPKHAVLIK